jgi:hypothetical protein
MDPIRGPFSRIMDTPNFGLGETSGSKQGVKFCWANIPTDLNDGSAVTPYSRLKIGICNGCKKTIRIKSELACGIKSTILRSLEWRGSQVVRHGSAKAAFVGSIPTLASSPFC